MSRLLAPVVVVFRLITTHHNRDSQLYHQSNSAVEVRTRVENLQS